VLQCPAPLLHNQQVKDKENAWTVQVAPYTDFFGIFKLWMENCEELEFMEHFTTHSLEKKDMGIVC